MKYLFKNTIFYKYKDLFLLINIFYILKNKINLYYRLKDKIY